MPFRLSRVTSLERKKREGECTDRIGKSTVWDRGREQEGGTQEKRGTITTKMANSSSILIQTKDI